MSQSYLGDEAYDGTVIFERRIVVRAQHHDISWFMLGRFSFLGDVVPSFETGLLDFTLELSESELIIYYKQDARCHPQTLE